MQRGIELDGLTVESADLEDVYLSLVGEDEDSEDSGRADG